MATHLAEIIPEYPMARAAGCPLDPPPVLRTLPAVSRFGGSRRCAHRSSGDRAVEELLRYLLLDTNPSDELHDDARGAAALCPSRAITIIEP